MGLLEFLQRKRRREEARERELARLGAGENRIVLIPGAGGVAGADFLSDSQTGEVHRVFERGGQRQVDAVPIVRRLLNRDISLRNVALLPLRSEHFGEHFFGAHFVLDQHLRHVYRVLITPRCCLAERLWGKGLAEVDERPLGGALIAWCDRHDEPAHAALEAVHSLLPESRGWGLRFVSLQTEPGSDIERRLFLGAPGAVRLHTRPGARGVEGAIEIEWQKRILLVAGTARAERKPALRVLGETGTLPF